MTASLQSAQWNEWLVTVVFSVVNLEYTTHWYLVGVKAYDFRGSRSTKKDTVLGIRAESTRLIGAAVVGGRCLDKSISPMTILIASVKHENAPIRHSQKAFTSYAFVGVNDTMVPRVVVGWFVLMIRGS